MQSDDWCPVLQVDHRHPLSKWLNTHFCWGDMFLWMGEVYLTRFFSPLILFKTLLTIKDSWYVVCFFFGGGCLGNSFYSEYRCIYIGTTPHPVRVTTRTITFLVGDPYKPSFVTVTGWGDNPIYTYVPSKPAGHPFSDPSHFCPGSLLFMET